MEYDTLAGYALDYDIENLRCICGRNVPTESLIVVSPSKHPRLPNSIFLILLTIPGAPDGSDSLHEAGESTGSMCTIEFDS
jgi:hypothetical protein